MNILITSAGRRVSLVEAFQKELKEIFPKGKVMTTDFNIKLSAACQISDGSFQLPLVSDDDYFDLLLKVCLENEIKLIIPTIDTELLLLAKKEKQFLKHGIKPIIASQKFVEMCRDKRQIHVFFEENNVQIAKEYSKYDYKLPIFIKPKNGSRSIDTYTITKHEQLTKYHFKNDDLMFLKYLDHDEFEEYTCDLYYDKNHDLKCVVPRKRIEVRDGEVNKCVAEKGPLVDYIKERLSFIDGAIGCLTAQFFKHKKTDEIFGIEINARFGGGYPLSYFVGANYPKWLIQEYLLEEDITIDYLADWEENLLMLRYDKEVLVHDYKA
ncbi:MULTISPECIES: ATP-grasp domain-containing protein [unclassified Algibacter]|uniref:ATP-grasp domain-containing protein n=1 Tax=unclassified Algibacter TaxID=2615009 RepID=UPI00131B1B08|nr:MULTISPECIES: ATP-grasp domain-containing protein [unclassified Algibacter]MCL5127870.1 ATP-grasp domain-containing protein [Algibacter sp. L4_22]